MVNKLWPIINHFVIKSTHLENVQTFPMLFQYLYEFAENILSQLLEMIQIVSQNIYAINDIFSFYEKNLIYLIIISKKIKMQSGELFEYPSQTDFPSVKEYPVNEVLKNLNIEPYPLLQEGIQPQSRSWKLNCQVEQISFGSKLLDQHKEVIQKNIQKFSESLKSLLKQDDIILFQKDKTNNLKILITHNLFMQEKQRTLFFRQLEYQDLFYKILDFSVSQLSQDFANEVIYVAYLLWEKYIQIRKKFMVQEELMYYASQFISEKFDKIFYDPRVKILSGQQLSFKEEKGEENMRIISGQLLKIFSETFLFVIEGFAQNPNSQTNPMIVNKFTMNAAPFLLYHQGDNDSEDETQHNITTQ